MLPANQEREVVPYFSAPWVYSEDGKVIADGEWALKISSAHDKLEIAGVATNGIVGVVDLVKPIITGGTIVKIGDAAFNSNGRIKELRLPETVTNIACQAFQSYGNLKTVKPFLPKSVSVVGTRSFVCTPVESSLVLANKNLTSIPESAEYGAFRGSKFATVDLSKSGIRSIGGYTFIGNGNLTFVSFPPTLETIGSMAFDSASSLLDVEFRSCPEISTTAFRYSKTLPARITFPRDDAGWAAFIESGTLHTWVGASDAQRNDYLAIFPAKPKPIGYMSIGGVNKWLVPRSARGAIMILK